MQVINIKNISKKGITLLSSTGAEVFLPPGQEFAQIDVTNLKQLGERVSYVANLTEVGSGKPKKTVLFG